MSLETRIRPPFVLAFFAALALIADHVVGAPPAGALRWGSSAALLSLGAAIAIIGLRTSAKAHTTHDPLRPESASALVTQGIYAWTRNPMYVGLTLMLTGICVWSGGGAGIGLVPAFVAYIDRFQIRPEERALRRKFGEAFEVYRTRVRRWL